MSTRLHPARLVERVAGKPVADRLRAVRWALAHYRPALRPRRAAANTALWAREPIGRRAYRTLDESELLATRRSDTAFVFGSGASLRRIEPREWELMAQHDVVAFSHFHRQRWIRVDYHLVAEVASAAETAASMRANPLYADTIYGMQKGWLAQGPNEIVADRLLPAGARIFRWRRIARGRVAPASRRLGDGLVHGSGSIQDVVNFALVMGWRRIVIAGVDLRGAGYFWMDDVPPTTTERWGQAGTVLAALGLWREDAEPDGVELLTYSADSLLAEVLPVFDGAF